VISVCTGAFLLAEAGLLAGRTVTTHWAYCEAMARRFPDVSVLADPIFVRDGNLVTSAGVTCGIDLALALVEEDLGRDAALTVARHLVVFLRRPGNQAQFSAHLASQFARRPPLRALQHWIAQHPGDDLSVPALAGRASLSPRQFSRAFAAEAGVTPGRYVDQVRLEAARRQLEDTAGADRRSLRIRHHRDHAPGVPAHARNRPRRIPAPVPPRPATPDLASHDHLREDMDIAILLYDRFTALDAVGPYEVLSQLPGARVIFVAEQAGPVTADTGRLRLVAEATLAELPQPGVLLVPGGPGQAAQMDEGPVHEWLRTADQSTTWTTSVCTGSLILAAAGLLQGRNATSYWLAVDQLPAFGATAVDQRVVVDGKYVTAAGVSSGIDMALTLAGRIAGDEAAQAIQLGIEYDPQPPYDAGAPGKAPAAITAALRARSRFILTGQRGTGNS
jgi:transcriptional regulator GlxA family with amidase domain